MVFQELLKTRVLCKIRLHILGHQNEVDVFGFYEFRKIT